MSWSSLGWEDLMSVGVGGLSGLDNSQLSGRGDGLLACRAR